MAREYPLTFYNVDNGRDPGQVAKEVRALLDPRPAILGLCETDMDLPGVEDYRLLRDRSRPGRQNIAAYVKDNLEVSDLKWLDLTETWSRTNPQASGQHWPRSILEFRAGRLMVWVAHAPPKGTDNVAASQREHADKLVARMAPWTRDDWADRTSADKAAAKDQARVILWDANRKPGEGDHGPDSVGRSCDASHAGKKIDLSTYRGGEVKGMARAEYFSSIGGVPLKSDHGHAFRFDLLLYDL